MSVFGPLLDGLPAIAFETRLPLTLVSMSKHWEEITGQPVQEALGLGWLERLDPNSVSVAFSEMEETLRGGGDIRYVVRCRAREDKWVWLRIVARPVMEGGVPVGVWGLGLVVPGAEMLDDAARVRVEEMERAQASSDALLSTSPDLLFHVGSAGQFLGYRAGDQTQLFMRPADFLGKTFEEVMPPVVANDSRKALDLARQTGRAQTFAYSVAPNRSRVRSPPPANPKPAGSFSFTASCNAPPTSQPGTRSPSAIELDPSSSSTCSASLRCASSISSTTCCLSSGNEPSSNL